MVVPVRVCKGAFGACLMGDVDLVAGCLNAMQNAAPDCEITVKHRIGIDKQSEYQVVADFVGTLREKNGLSHLYRSRAKCVAGRFVAQGKP